MVITETRMGGDQADAIIRTLPFNGAYSTETIGYVGGIWLLWNSDFVDVEILSTTKQEVNALIRVNSSSLTWLISAIYASPIFVEKCILCNNLRIIASRHNLPWLALGDFNDVLSEDDKFGGNGIYGRRVRAYREYMNECKLLDLGFSGPKYTWTNKRDVSNLIQQRLDREWANTEWKLNFPKAAISHLPRINSDHCPILLNLEGPNMGRGERPFRFQPFWLNYPEFLAVVRQA